MTGTDEVSLDDVVGDHAVAHGFAYASVDRDGIGGSTEGLNLTKAFASRMRARVFEKLGREVDYTYIAGLSMGGVIARYAAEDQTTPFDGVLIHRWRRRGCDRRARAIKENGGALASWGCKSRGLCESGGDPGRSRALLAVHGSLVGASR